MKKFFILCCFVSSLAFGMENAKVMQSEADLSAILTHLSDRIYCIGETTRSLGLPCIIINTLSLAVLQRE